MVSMTVDETEKLIGAALCKIYSLDLAPTWLVKEKGVRNLL